MTLLSIVYFGCALAGVIFHFVTTGKKEEDRPTALQWLKRHPMYALGALGLTFASAVVFMPAELGVAANVSALSMGIAGGSAIKNLFIRQ